jgi:protein-S-isoprenylcysteine O-methyltransferase Ste14
MAAGALLEHLRIPLSRIVIGGVVVLFLVSTSRWASSPVADETIFGLGCILAGLGAFGRIWCSLYIAGYKDKILITAGPYAMCRNPLYLFSLVGAIGVGLATECFTVPALLLAAFALYYPAIISAEEARLSSLHGPAFDEYRKNVPCFIPKRAPLHHVESHTINPKVVFSHLASAVWFVIGIGMIEFVEGLHEAGWLPVYFRLF